MLLYRVLFVFSVWLVQSFAKDLNSLADIKTSAVARAAFTPVVKEYARLNLQHGVAKKDRVSASDLHKVVIAVNQANLGDLKSFVDDVSNPLSAKYGDYLTRAELDALTSAPASSQQVLSFLNEQQITVVSRSRNDHYITAEAPIAKWEEILSAEFYHFDLHTHGSVKRALQYSVPAALEVHISAIFHVVDFPSPLPEKRVMKGPKPSTSVSTTSTTLPTCQGYSGYVCPAVLNAMYNMQSNTGNALASQAVFASLNQSMSPSDLTYFQTAFDLPVEGISSDVGGHVSDDACVPNDGEDCGEANLDIQYLMGVSQGVPTTYYYYPDADSVIDWLAFITTIADMEDPPLVITISYSSYESPISPSTLDAFNTEAMKVAALGVTMMASSGDDGVAGFVPRFYGSEYCGYGPQFPASSPYVTAVGGTQGIDNGDPEIACQSQLEGVITTGGGMSEHYATPSWQQTQVDAYFASQSPPTGYNRNGRGYPDVSLVAVDYFVALDQTFPYPIYGTSASSPVFAAMVSLVNAARLAAGKTSLGWINPSLYAYADKIVLNDITSGENNCVAETQTGVLCCTEGFNCAEGWDPVTGIGSIDFTAFKNTFMTIGDPTMPPTSAPTAAPIFTVKFSAVQVIDGIDLTTYNSNKALYSSTLTKTIAMCMDGVQSSDITSLVVTSATTSVTQRLRNGVLASSISASYVVTSTDASATYATLSAQLQNSVDIGSFDTYLHDNAAASGATGFASASSTAVTTTDLEPDSGDGDKNGLSAGAIAGIVIACVVVVALIGVGAFFLLRRASSIPLAAAAVQASAPGSISLNPVNNTK